MQPPKTSFIATVLNEEKTIILLLKSLLKQVKKTDEIIIVDGGSSDNTLNILQTTKKEFEKKKIKFSILQKKGNRSVGRNEAIKKTTGDIILCTDAGCILDDEWVKNILEPFKDKKIDVVAGYYQGKAKSIFQKCLIPYVLVMEDKINPDNFLPATRSMAFRKSIWRRIGGFDEAYSHNEDYVFANKLREKRAKIFFQKKAIVNWIPRKNLSQAFKMFWRFAYGDAEALIWRPKVLLIFTRYFLGLYLIFLTFLYKSFLLGLLVFTLLPFYLIWAIAKNYRYVNDFRAFIVLPILQLTSDAAVISGSVLGFLAKFVRIFPKYIKENKNLFLIIAVYWAVMLSVIKWGLPEAGRPYPYHMDEWHFLSSIYHAFKNGTTTMPGAGHIPMLYPFISGLYLAPLLAVSFINPFSLTSVTENYQTIGKVFELLRINTLLFGTGSIILIYQIAKFLKLNGIIAVALMVFTPIFLSLSNYYKYDLALIFFILASIFTMLNYIKNKKELNFIIAGVLVGLAVSVKISGLPLVPVYLLLTFLSNEKVFSIKQTITGALMVIAIFMLFGIPNVLFGKGNYSEFLFSNLIEAPNAANNLILRIPFYNYIFMKVYPITFGFALFFVFIISFFYLLVRTIKNKKSEYVLILLSFILFLLSLLSIKSEGLGNRLLPLLPFIALISTSFLSRFSGKNLLIAASFLISFQVIQSYSWVSLKLNRDPRVEASNWISNNLKSGSTIGIENIPIYQMLPDIALKEYYLKIPSPNNKTNYDFKLVDSKTDLPKIVLVTNFDIDKKYLKKSDKKDLINILEKEKYISVAEFYPRGLLADYFYSRLDFFVANIGPLVPISSIAVYKKSDN